MKEREPKKSIEQTPQDRVITEDEYITRSVEYALSSGWVKEKQKNDLIETYLKPIYRHYEEIIKEVEHDLRDESDKERTLASVINLLNACLESTKRIGVTDPNNILRSVRDLYNLYKNKDQYREYALMSMWEFLGKLLSS